MQVSRRIDLGPMRRGERRGKKKVEEETGKKKYEYVKSSVDEGNLP